MNRFKFLFRAALALGAALLVWNIFVGVFIRFSHSNVVDADLGTVYPPNTLFIRGTEGYSIIPTDKFGFNNPEVTLPVDLLFLGDSYTEAMQVMPDQNFVQMTKALLETHSKSVSVYNGGHSGLSIANYLATSEGFLKRFSPQLTIIQMTRGDLGADLINPSQAAFIEALGDGWKVVSKAPSSPTPPSLRSKLGEILNWVAPIWKYSLIISEEIFQHNPWGTRLPFLPEDNIKKNQAPPKVQELNISLISWTIAEIQKRFGKGTILLYLRYSPRLDGNGGIFQKDDQEEAVAKILEKLCRENELVFLDTKNAFEESLRNTHIFPRGFGNTTPDSGHLNPTGHRAVAGLLVPTLLEVLK